MSDPIRIELEPAPAPPALDLSVHPEVASIRERLARLETRAEQQTSDPAAAEALRLAGEAHQLASRVDEQLRKTAESAPDPAKVVEVTVPPSDPAPVDPATPNEPPQPEGETPEHRRPWWHPSRLL